MDEFDRLRMEELVEARQVVMHFGTDLLDKSPLKENELRILLMSAILHLNIGGMMKTLLLNENEAVMYIYVFRYVDGLIVGNREDFKKVNMIDFCDNLDLKQKGNPEKWKDLT